MGKNKTGIFYHYQQGERLKNAVLALDGILDQDHVIFYDALYDSAPDTMHDIPPVPVSLLKKVHDPDMIDRLTKTREWNGALYSASGTYNAALKIMAGEITNAFIYTGYGDHHAGKDFWGGGCLINGAAAAICAIREKFNTKRIVVIDTDAHHGDGSWDLYQNDSDTMFICFCSGPYDCKNNNINIQIPYNGGNDVYLLKAKDTFEKHILSHAPELIIWNWGYDGTIGDYGDMGLTPEFHIKMAMMIKDIAQHICNGKLLTVLCGGSRRDLAELLIPNVIKVLAGL